MICETDVVTCINSKHIKIHKRKTKKTKDKRNKNLFEFKIQS